MIVVEERARLAARAKGDVVENEIRRLRADALQLRKRAAPRLESVNERPFELAPKSRDRLSSVRSDVEYAFWFMLSNLTKDV